MEIIRSTIKDITLCILKHLSDLNVKMPISKEALNQIAKQTLCWPNERKWDSKDSNNRFRSCFGASIGVVLDIWNRVEPILDQRGAEPKHLLWALVFLKVYSTEEIHCSIVGWPHCHTFRKWSWYFIQKIADLKDSIIILDNRFARHQIVTTNCFMSVDTTDCPIYEPWPFDTKWYCQKSNGPGVKYEVGVAITTGNIVWINGPMIGSANDGTIFCNKLSGLLCDDEGVEVDGGYKGDAKLKSPSIGFASKDRKQKSIVRARHESINSRLKIFNILNIPFRHVGTDEEKLMEKHGWCFTAIAVITQLKFDAGEDKLYEVEYETNYF
jgi:hypothetical protein